MSNATGAFGLKPIRMWNGSPWNGMAHACYVGATYGTALYVGDPVILSNETDDRDATGHKLSVELASMGDTNKIFGVIVGMEPLVTDLSKQYNPASTARVVYVAPADGVIYQIRGCGGGTPVVGWVGLNAVLYQGTASTAFGTSGVMLDEGTSDGPAADLSNQLLILNYKNVEDNEVGDYAIYEVLINIPNDLAGTHLGIAGA